MTVLWVGLKRLINNKHYPVSDLSQSIILILIVKCFGISH